MTTEMDVNIKELEDIIQKHYWKLHDAVAETNKPEMLELFPSVFLQMLINELFRTQTPMIVTATVLTILAQKTAQEAYSTKRM